MALARVDDQQPGGAPRRQQSPVRLDRAAQLRHVVAEHLAEAAGLEEIALHVDDQQRAMGGRERERVRFGGKVDGRCHPIDPVRGPPPVSGPLRPDARTVPAA